MRRPMSTPHKSLYVLAALCVPDPPQTGSTNMFQWADWMLYLTTGQLSASARVFLVPLWLFKYLSLLIFSPSEWV